jgi:2-dehydropantoate 2-reductase
MGNDVIQGTPKIWIIGTGAVGSALAALLRQFGEADVVLVGESIHWRQITDQGLQFEIADQQPTRISIPTVAPADLPHVSKHDLVLLTGKLPNLHRAVALLKRSVSPETPIIALQNGFQIDRTVSEQLCRPIGRGLIMFGALVPEPGHVIYFPGKALLRPSHATAQLARQLATAPLVCETSDDFISAEWSKLAVNCLANPLAGLMNRSNAELAATELNPVKEAILSEVQSVAAAAGIELKMTVESFNRYMTGPTGRNIASLHSDLKRGSMTEIDSLNGFIVQEAASHGIDAPVNRLITDMIHYLSASKML